MAAFKTVYLDSDMHTCTCNGVPQTCMCVDWHGGMSGRMANIAHMKKEMAGTSNVESHSVSAFFHLQAYVVE